MPSQIGHYQILKVLYYDPEGQSIVYEAWDPDLQRKVALKTVNWPFLGPEATEHFLHEMRTLAEVVHPNVVPVLTAGNDAGVLYYTTPLIDGLSLDKHVENRRAQMRERL
jgi:serine/threonine protein kinase